MANTTTKDLSVSFGLDNGTNLSFTIPDYNPEVADATKALTEASTLV